MKRIYLPLGWDPAKPIVLHAMARTIDGTKLFRSDLDNAAFEDAVQAAAKDSDLEVLSYCPNGNHYHLLLFCTKAAMGPFMHKLQTALSRRTRVKYGGRGHVFMRPYLAGGKVGRTSILDCWAYVNANPFKDGVVDSLARGNHSSLPYFLDATPPPSFLSTKRIHELVVNGTGASPAEACRSYLLGWVSNYPKLLHATAEALKNAGKPPRGGFRHPERVTKLISLTQALTLQFTREGRDGTPTPPWLLTAAVLQQQERLTIREIAVLVRRSRCAVLDGLKRLAKHQGGSASLV
jgi:REP element-mobilizing transposase RayT